MKMPDEIGAEMLAPCGMLCLVCYRHCDHKKPCGGCLGADEDKPKHCWTCKIKVCVEARGVRRCLDCGRFLCMQLQALDRRYQARYGVSLVNNGRLVQAQGIETFLQTQRGTYTCTSCGGIISLHDAVCSGCRASHAAYKREDVPSS